MISDEEAVIALGSFDISTIMTFGPSASADISPAGWAQRDRQKRGIRATERFSLRMGPAASFQPIGIARMRSRRLGVLLQVPGNA